MRVCFARSATELPQLPRHLRSLHYFKGRRQDTAVGYIDASDLAKKIPDPAKITALSRGLRGDNSVSTCLFGFMCFLVRLQGKIRDERFLAPLVSMYNLRKVGQMVFLAIKIPDPANFTERVRAPGGEGDCTLKLGEPENVHHVSCLGST